MEYKFQRIRCVDGSKIIFILINGLFVLSSRDQFVYYENKNICYIVLYACVP